MRKVTISPSLEQSVTACLYISVTTLWRLVSLAVFGATVWVVVYTVQNREFITQLMVKDMDLMDNVTSLDAGITTLEGTISTVNMTLSTRIDTVEQNLEAVNTTLSTRIDVLDGRVTLVENNLVLINNTLSARDDNLQGQIDTLMSSSNTTMLEMRVTVNEMDIVDLKAKDMTIMDQISTLTSLGDLLVNSTMDLNTTVLQALMDAMTLEGRVETVENKTTQNMMDIMALQAAPGDGIGIGVIRGFGPGFGMPSLQSAQPTGSFGAVELYSQASTGADVCINPSAGSNLQPEGVSLASIQVSAAHLDGYGTSVAYSPGQCGGSTTRIDLNLAEGNGIQITPDPAMAPTPVGSVTIGVQTGQYLVATPSGLTLRANVFRPNGVGDIGPGELGTPSVTCDAEGQAVAGPCVYPFGYVGPLGALPWRFGRVSMNLPNPGCANGWSGLNCRVFAYSADMITDQDPSPSTVRYGVSSTSTTDWWIQSTFRFTWPTMGIDGVAFKIPETAAFEFELNVVAGAEYAAASTVTEFKPCKHTHHISSFRLVAGSSYYSDVSISCHWTSSEGAPGTASHPAQTSVIGWVVTVLGGNTYVDDFPDFDMYHLKETITGLQRVA